MMKEKSRRDFLKISGLTTAASLLAMQPTSAKTSVKEASLKLGLASYSLRKFSLDQTIAMTKRAGLKYLCLKSMHLPLDSTEAEIKKAADKVKKAGLVLYGGGVIYMNSPEEVDRAFVYAKQAGMETIVGVPAPELLNYTNDKIKEYDIKVAIHNHGPGDKKYPSPKSVWDKIKDLDPRFGLCIDIGHTERIGVDPTEAATAYFSRLFDLHIKDVNQADGDGGPVIIGRGIIDIPKFMKMLVDKGYQGTASIEFEIDADDPMPGLGESEGYVKDCLASMR